ncbi:general transcription factor IIF subunit 2-like [Procambarus clarkii]|uniref:general transcription factor IIF subunit 2-like n=1 Tax=Procambarus clarkii TaxID=6728 RepID=UPI003742EA4E
MSQQSKMDLDITNCSRGLWLVKVPKYLGDKWADCAGHDVGKLKITKVPGKPPTITFKSSEHTLKDGKIPREHKVIYHSLKEMTLGVLSEPDLGSSSSDAAVSETQQLSFEGQVIHKLECQPVVDDYYINQKREAVKKAAQSLHTVKLIDRPLNGYKPISHHKHNVYLEQKKKAEGKTIRDDKDKVMELLFAAFEKHHRGLWLVKVPKYLGDKWADCAGHDVGKLKITKVPGKHPTITFKSSEHTLKDGKIPREHKVISHCLKEMTLGVLSEPDLGSSSSDAAVSETQQLSFEGQVIHKLECQPVVDDYINQKREAVKKAAQSLHTKKKAEGKTIRDDKDKVMELLFAAFEKHQYYNIKDLHKITRQPITYLKEILKDLCNYNVKNPHKNMWELKPEYRHYKLAEKAVENSMYD